MPNENELTEEKNKKLKEDEIKPRKRSNSFASLLQKASNMANGITTHLELLNPRGLNQELSQKILILVEETRKLDSEQKVLRGQVKEKTTKVQENSDAIRDILSECTLMVKAVVSQDRWVDFGIFAKR